MKLIIHGNVAMSTIELNKLLFHMKLEPTELVLSDEGAYAKTSIMCRKKRVISTGNGVVQVAIAIRNRKMAEYADVLLLIWDGKDADSKNMKNIMTTFGKPIHEVIL